MSSHAQDDRAGLLRQAIRLKRAAARSRPELPSRPPQVEARLSETQRGLWLLHRLDPASAAYHLASAYRSSQTLDLPRLQLGLERLVARHRILRSTFRARGDSARQVIHPRSSEETSRIRVERFTAEPGEAVAVAVLEARRPFDLEAGPLLRLLLIEEPSGACLLVLVLHHILADERSLEVLWEELAEGYDGRPSAAEGPQYDDYVHWQAGRELDREAALEVWRQRLEPLPGDLELPFERASARGEARGRLLRKILGQEVLERIRSFAAGADTTPFIVLAFAFRLLLHRITGGRDVAFATAASTRSHPATALMVGYFLNPVPIRVAVDEKLSVTEAVRGFRRTMREDLGSSPVPFDVLVEELAPPRRQDRHPLFQTMFVYQESPPPPVLGGIRLEPTSLDLGVSKFDLTLFASGAPGADADGTLEIAVEYRADRFDEVWMEALLGHYRTLIEHLVDDPERPVAEVPMLRPEENDRLRAAALGAAGHVVGPDLVPRQIMAWVRETPLAPAAVGGDHAWTYGELGRVAGGIAGQLAGFGVGPGDRVGLFVERSARMIAGILGCHLAGAAYVPLDPGYPADRNRAVLADARISALVIGSQQAASLLGASAGNVVIVVAGTPEGEGEIPAPPVELDAEHPAYLLYTSGSTGRPKGVVVTHGNLKASNDARFSVYDAPPGRFLLLPSVAFDSSVAGIFWTLASGGTLVLPTDEEARDPRRLARLIAEQKVNSLLCVPSLYGPLLAEGRGGLEHLETVIVAGESCPPRLVKEHFQRLPQARLFNEYGPTEITVWATVHEIERDEAMGSVAIGRPIPGVRVEVLDELGRRVPAGVPGHGWVSGPTVARGYWRRPELTGTSFLPHGAGSGAGHRTYRTGDLLRWSADHRLEFLGRADDQIKLRGFRIEPGEVEAVLREAPEIVDAAVVARVSGRLAAFVATGGAGSAGDGASRQRLAARLPAYMVPAQVVELAELPRLPNGKVDRGRLRTMAIAPESRGSEPEAAPPVLDEREQALITLWEGLLGRAGITSDDNFFQLGGHSLLVVEMTSAIERDFGVTLTPADIFEHPTIAQIARRIARRRRPGAPSYAHLFPIQPGGHGAPLIFSVPHFFTRMLATRFRGERPVYGLRGVSLRAEGNRGRWPTMRDLAGELVDEAVRRFPGESYYMAGYSFGASMAVEAVRLMEERGLPVRGLYLIAPMPVDVYRAGPLRLQLDGLRHGVEELSLPAALRHFARDNHPLKRRPYQRARRLLLTQPWRRLLCLVGRFRFLTGRPLTPRILHADVRLERFRLHARYRPGIVHTPTVIFNAREPATDAAATWRPYFGGPFTVREIPDPHLGQEQVDAAKELILRHWRDLGEE